MPIWHQSPKLTPRYFLETPRLFGYPQQVQIDIPASHPDTCHDLLLTQTFHMDEQNTYNPHIMLDKPPSSPALPYASQHTTLYSCFL